MTLNDLHSVKIFEKYIFVFGLIVSLIEKTFTLDYHTSSKPFLCQKIEMSVPLRKCSSILIQTNLRQININSENPSKKTSLSEDPMTASTGPKHKGSVTSLDSEVGKHKEAFSTLVECLYK